jgi:WXXGXW repeat (2 copies)
MPLRAWSRSLLPTFFLLALPALAIAQVSVNISVGVPPPELPVYDQPPIPDDGYIWTPGYWAWSDDVQDYYWVPGTWVPAPEPDYLWTPGYWGAEGAVFFWHSGYWGPHVGFYGGVNYGYGYGGNGYEGGYWRGGHLYYNRSVNNISNTRITNVYNSTVINNVTVNRVSYNGGNGGVRAQPTAAEAAAARDRHLAVTPVQHEHEQAARSNPVLRASQNQGHPPIAATPRPGSFSGAGVVPARGGTMSVVHSQSQPQAESQRQVQPQRQAESQRQTQPQPRAESQRQAQPQPQAESQRQAQPQPRAAQPETRMPQAAPHPAAPDVQRQQRPPVESRPPVEQRRPPEQAQPPRQGAPPPPSAPRPEPKPREAPRPAEHPPEH